MSKSIKKSMLIITDALRADRSEGSYYYAWQSNIAMAIFDTLPENTIDKHYLANKAAKRFLDQLCWRENDSINTLMKGDLK